MRVAFIDVHREYDINCKHKKRTFTYHLNSRTIIFLYFAVEIFAARSLFTRFIKRMTHPVVLAIFRNFWCFFSFFIHSVLGLTSSVSSLFRHFHLHILHLPYSPCIYEYVRTHTYIVDAILHSFIIRFFFSLYASYCKIFKFSFIIIKA